MKKLELYKKIAILLDKTEYDIWDICEFLNAYHNYYLDNTVRIYDYEQYMVRQTSFTKEQFEDLNQAYSEMLFEDEYSLAKKYAIISNCVVNMEECEFDRYNPDLFEEAENHLDEIGDQILEECIKHYCVVCEDIMDEGKIREDKINTAVYRYMINNGFQIEEFIDEDLN